MAQADSLETTQDFLDRFGSMVTHGFMSLSMALGVKTGLFETLIDLHKEEHSSQEIADAAGLKERYVREWLGAMVVGNIVDVNPKTEKYRLPAHRVPIFTQGSLESGSTNMLNAIPMLCTVYDKIADCLKKDGPLGLPYSDYETFHVFMGRVTSRWITHHLVQDFIPSLPKLEKQLKSGMKILDLGCGSGIVTAVFAENYPNCELVGIDVTEECISISKGLAEEKNLTNTEFVLCDAVKMPAEWGCTFDYVFANDTIHDLPRADKALEEICRILKPGGRFSMIEPEAASKHSGNAGQEGKGRLYTMSLFHCLPISLFFEGSVGLGTAWGRERATEFLEASGLEVESISKPPSSISLHYLCSKPK